MTDLESDKKYIADHKLRTALRIAEPYDGPWIDYERTYTIGAVVQELKVREEALRVLAAAYRAEKERADKLQNKVQELQELLRLITEKQALVPTCYTEPGEEIWDKVLVAPVRLEPGEWS